MNTAYAYKVSNELNLGEWQIEASAALLAEGATIPFIARYRKEATGSLDEVYLTRIRDRLNQLEELDARKETILNSLEKNGHLTDELREAVRSAETISNLEDIYLPYRPKRRTRASVAREKGLEPLADALLAQTGVDPDGAADAFIDPEKGILSREDALSGARDIIAERINEDVTARERIRDLFSKKGVVRARVATGKESEGAKFRDYFQWDEPVATAPSHRILAMRRGEKEDILNLTIAPEEDEALRILENLFIKAEGADADQVKAALQDGYRRLLMPSMETEIRLSSKERADAEAIKIFAENLRHLLLSPPLGAKRVMGLDPGFRTGCKLVCLDAQGKLLHHDTIYPHQSENQRNQAAETVRKLCSEFGVEAIGVGNGTAGRETEAFLRAIPFEPKIPVLLVNESGASIYSASKIAREEFPDLDLTVRGSVSIGRRLMDPLAELVKIDPKSIGVGQYQHDVDQNDLKSALDDVVISCVNAVGVDVNRASVQLLTYVSGLGPQLAKNIVAFRDGNGAFRNRENLKEVPRLGPKAFEQCAGFLRIPDGENPLDASAVHPESYPVVEAMASDLHCTITDLIKNAALREKVDIRSYVSGSIGIPTLSDIMKELAKPGRDPRQSLETIAFAEGIEKISDLTPGMKLPGVVTNVTAFGAFVDVGVHQDGLVHVSELADGFVKTPSDVVKVNQRVMVTVMEVDLDRNRISLSMKKIPGERNRPASKPKKAAPPKTQKREPQPFNNPFAEAFGKKERGREG
jgi:uncharacterized protein